MRGCIVSLDSITMSRSRRMRGAEHAASMGEMRNAYKMLVVTHEEQTEV
jgi:hypothetical protein